MMTFCSKLKVHNCEYSGKTVEMVMCEVGFQEFEFYIVTAYRSPKINLTVFTKALARILEKHSDKGMIIVGDFNSNSLNAILQMEGFMKSRNFIQLVKKATCDTGSCLDHIYISEGLQQFNWALEVNNCFYSDHKLLVLKLNSQ